MGLTLAIASAAFLGLSVVCARVGMRTRPRDDGVFMSVLVNAVLLALLLPFLGSPRWDWLGITAFVVAGLATTWAGRATALRSVRLIGAARASTFFISAPFFTALLGWIMLGEAVRPLQFAGGVLIVGGILVVTRSQVMAEPLAGMEGMADSPRREGGHVWEIRAGRAGRGMAIALISGFFFGLGHAMRKLGIVHYPSAVVGGFVGTMTALVVIVTGETIRGHVSQLVDDNLTNIPRWFVVSGLFSGVGVLCTFAALLYLPVWIVSSCRARRVCGRSCGPSCSSGTKSISGGRSCSPRS